MKTEIQVYDMYNMICTEEAVQDRKMNDILTAMKELKTFNMNATQKAQVGGELRKNYINQSVTIEKIRTAKAILEEVLGKKVTEYDEGDYAKEIPTFGTKLPGTNLVAPHSK